MWVGFVINCDKWNYDETIKKLVSDLTSTSSSKITCTLHDVYEVNYGRAGLCMPLA